MNSPIVAYIDYREVDSGIPEILKNKLGLAVELKNLDSGDYVFGEVCIERKTIGDLLSSATGDGRLWEQLGVMKDNFQKPMLLLEGELPSRTIRESYILRQRVLGIISAIFLSFGIPIITVKDKEEASALISQIFIKSTHVGEGLKPVKKKRKTPKDIQEEMLVCLPRISRGKAKQFMKEAQFKEILGWNKEKWASIKGLGKDAVDIIVEVLG